MSAMRGPKRAGAAPRERGGPAKAIGDVLPGALRALGVPSRAASRRVAGAWKQIADRAWLGRAAPVRLEGGVLVVAVESAPLREELAQFHAERLRSALRSALPEETIVSIRFEAGRVGGVARGAPHDSPEVEGSR